MNGNGEPLHQRRVRALPTRASASRPAWSALENRMLRCTVGDEMRPWQEALTDFFEELEARRHDNL